jgi:hypothetical protein
MDDLPFPEEETAVQVLDAKNILGDEITKMKIKYAADTLVGKLVEAGEQDPLRAYIGVKAVKELLSEIEGRLKAHAIQEAKKYGKEDGSVMGIRFENTTTATNYSYEHDSEWQSLKGMVEDAQKLLKEREGLMKSAMKFSNVVDEDGQEVQPAVIKSGGDDSIRVIIPSG